MNNGFEAVLNRREVCLGQDLQRQYDRLAADVDVKKLENYLRRQVRTVHRRPKSDTADGCSLGERKAKADFCASDGQ